MQIIPFEHDPFALIAEVEKIRAERVPDEFTCSAKGFVVPTGRTITMDAAKVSARDFYKFAHKNAGALMVWQDGAKLHIGACAVSGGVRDAVNVALEHKQSAIFDLAAGKAIRLSAKFDENHDEAGRFTFGDGGSEFSGMVNRLSKEDGGFTIQPVSGKEVEAGSKHYGVSIAGHEKVISAKDLSRETIGGYVRQNSAMWRDSEKYFGGWHQPGTGKIFLDVSVVKDTPEEAEKIGRASHQEAYFDFENMRSVPIDYGGK